MLPTLAWTAVCTVPTDTPAPADALMVTDRKRLTCWIAVGAVVWLKLPI